MYSNLDAPTDPHGEDTSEIRQIRRKARNRERVEALLTELATARPARYYTVLTLRVAAVAVLDWVAVAAHTVLDRGQPLSAALGTHLVVVVTLTLSGVALGVGWAMWGDQCKREAKRDEVAALRHQEVTAWAARFVGANSNQVWESYVTGLREASGGGTPPHPSGVVPMRPRGPGFRSGSTGTERGR